MRYFLILLTITLVMGCTANPKRDQIRQQYYSTIPTCSSEKECEIKWSAARRWVLNNARMKLQHVEDDYLETYNSVGNTTNLAARVVKEPMGTGNSYRIVVTTWCANWFVCVPDKWEAALDFNRTVNSSYSSPKTSSTNSTANSSSIKPEERRVGESSISAEDYAQQIGCVSDDGVTVVGDMVVNDGPTETYLFECKNADILIRCEYGRCSEI
ncbi:hypothetical protein [Methylophaga sp.]|uniref:hypothetical protein n=1 Tax=Methylophaga sp. TaxID=2024840 RepID=UPI0013FE75AC|nr:hypothetical protein [Methylophaga sp.]MTI64403.1 hypothetical protein [Methylophaga sp.]